MSLYTVSLNPLEISDLVIWVDAADINTVELGSLSATDGALISKIVDKKSNIVFSNLSGTKPKYKHKFINGKNVINFDHNGTVYNNSLQSSMLSYLTLSEKTIFFVFPPVHSIIRETTPGEEYPLSIYGESNPIRGSLNYLPDISVVYNEGKFEVDYKESYSYGSPSVLRKTTVKRDINDLQIVGIRTTSDINKYDFIGNGTSIVLENQYGNETPKLNISRVYVTIGDIVDYTYTLPTPNQVIPFDGYFCELLIFTRSLSDYDYNRVNEYLQSKWIGS